MRNNKNESITSVSGDARTARQLFGSQLAGLENITSGRLANIIDKESPFQFKFSVQFWCILGTK